MKDCDKKLRDSLLRVMDEEVNAIREEMKQEEPHVFSEAFEQKMQEMMKVQKPKSKWRGIAGYAVAVAVVVVLVIGGVLLVGSEELRASDLGVKIQTWMENFFLVENDANREKDENTDVLFEESQIGYLPEGFEKVEEQILFSKVCYEYQNDDGQYIVLEVFRDKNLSGIDNDEIAQEAELNEAGLEYRYVYKADKCEHIFTWLNDKDYFYYLTGSLTKDEVMKIMNGISY